jgi:hypothetical protein
MIEVQPMLRYIVRILLTAAVFCYIYPKYDTGVVFHGAFWPTGVLYAAGFSLVAALFSFLLGLALDAFAIVTLGIGVLIIVPAYIVGFWLIPACQLQVFAHYFPQHLTVLGWKAAAIGGLWLLLVNFVSSLGVHGKSSKQ